MAGQGSSAAPAPVLTQPVAIVRTGALNIRSGPNSLFATVLRNSAAAGDLTVTLTNSDPNSLLLPATVLIPPGQTYRTFAVGLKDNNLVDGQPWPGGHRAERGPEQRRLRDEPRVGHARRELDDGRSSRGELRAEPFVHRPDRPPVPIEHEQRESISRVWPFVTMQAKT